MPLADDRKAALDAALKKIEKNYGKGAIMKLGEKVDQQISTIPSGSLALDVALGVGGYPRGRIVEVYGQKVLVKPQLLYTQSLKFKKVAEQQPLLMQNMH